MHIEIRVRRDALRRWHSALAERLSGRPDTRVSIAAVDGAGPGLPVCVETLFGLERVLGAPSGGLSDGTGAQTAPARWPSGGSTPDLCLDLVGETDDVSPKAARRWLLLFDGWPGDTAAIAGILALKAPLVSLVDASTGAVVASGRPGSEAPGTAVAAFDDLLARTTTLIVAALDGQAPILSSGERAAPSPMPIGCRPIAGRAAKTLARAAVRALYQRLYRAPHWRVGWRRVDGPDVVDRGGLAGSAWHDIPDDGLRFYADPFPITVAGTTHLFVEDFAHALGRGVISAVPFGPDGPVGTPTPVLDLLVHLSYPFVFEHEGEIWMIPETWQAGRIDLLRATRFPGGWVREATLVDNVEASDATLLRHGGRWWLMATVRDGGGSFSDALHLWSADAVTGPWRPHDGNPVLVDIASARPAGRVVERGGRLIRPVQDCRAGYGAALALAEITRLDDAAYEQRVTAIIEPGGPWAGRRLHTLNRAGNLEFIDGSRLARRF